VAVKPTMAEATHMGDVNESIAFSLIEDLKRAKKITDDDGLRYRSLFEFMHLKLEESREKEKALLKLVKIKRMH